MFGDFDSSSPKAWAYLLDKDVFKTLKVYIVNPKLFTNNNGAAEKSLTFFTILPEDYT